MKPETRERMLIKYAEQDGYAIDAFRTKEGKINTCLFNYDTDHNSMQRLIVGLSFTQLKQYERQLKLIVWRDRLEHCLIYFKEYMHKATCEQKFTAYCLTKGWLKAGEE